MSRSSTIRHAALTAQLNFRYRDDGGITVALDETTDVHDVGAIGEAFAAGFGQTVMSLVPMTYESVLDYPACGAHRAAEFPLSRRWRHHGGAGRNDRRARRGRDRGSICGRVRTDRNVARADDV